MPYLYGQAVTAHQEGIPMLRAMLVEFPDDPAADTLDRQYMLGDSLLVAPVLTEDGTVDYYLPEGRWTHLLTGEVQTGGRWRRAQHDFLSLPLFVRPNTILPVGAVDDRPDYDYTTGTTFRVYRLADGAAISRAVPTERGEPGIQLHISREGRKVVVKLEGGKTFKPWKLQLVGVKKVNGLKGGTAAAQPMGVVITPRFGARNLLMTLVAD
jgi:alpha-D-xyloside xylohydrolase